LAICSFSLGLLLGIWLAARNSDGAHVDPAWFLALELGPFVMLGVPAARAWRSRPGWYVLAVALVVNALLGGVAALSDFSLVRHPMDLPGIGLLWLCQYLVAVVAMVIASRAITRGIQNT
jgi:tellurite resistance protein TehA-like permease